MKSLKAPSKYIQGRNLLGNLEEYVEHLGEKFFVLISENGYKRFGETIKNSFEDESKVIFETFNGECSRTEINRVIDVVKEKGADVVIGVGGGKIHDTAKAVAYYEEKPIVIIPTVASTDAPTSALSVIYTDEGVVSEYLFMPKNPDLVLLDLDAIIGAPARLLVAGMGDALATKFEARSSRQKNALTMSGGYSTVTAATLADLAYELLITQGYSAKKAAENNVITKAVEDIVEANTLLSGLGFESGGLGAAHAVHDGFTVLSQTADLYHGEIVAYGTLTHLVLENAPREEIEEVMYFCREVGLPITLEELNLKDVTDEELMKVAESATAEGSSIHDMPFEVTPYDVFAAIKTVDSLGKDFYY